MKPGWSKLRVAFVSIGALTLLTGLFYAEEDWRGKHAWETYQQEIRAKGETVDWKDFIPAPVPNDQNFFAAPNMTDWFVRGHASDFYDRLKNSNTVATITAERDAREYLAWSDRFQPDFNQIRTALQRPYARMDGSYERPYEIPVPNFVNMRMLSQVLVQRARCNLLLGQTSDALQDLNLLYQSRHILESPPSGKPVVLVSSMIDVAITGLYVDAIASGMKSHSWREADLIVLENQLKQIDLPSFVCESLNEEAVGTARTLEITTSGHLSQLFAPASKTGFFQRLKDPFFLGCCFAPRGWVYQNMTFAARLQRRSAEGFDVTPGVFMPEKFDAAARQIDRALRHHTLWNMWAALTIPNVTKAVQMTANVQSKVNEAYIACALERYRLARGHYPDTLAALAPQFMESVPEDIIEGNPLHYRRTDDGKFLLYSVGWNRRDDNGKTLPPPKNGGPDLTSGDWVWQN